MKSPCEEIVWDVLPGIRAAIAEELIKRGLSQKEVSRLLGITPPAVSQYISKKRGYSIVFDQEAKIEIENLADDLIKNNAINLTERICRICQEIRGDEAYCRPDSCLGKS